MQPVFYHRHISSNILIGEGLEIGALHNPSPIPINCKCYYLDVENKTKLSLLFPEIEGQNIIDPNYIGDINKSSVIDIAHRTFDFIIANHILEHLSNPIQAFLNIWAGLEDEGYFMLSIPDKRYTFDRNRQLTSFNHLLAEFFMDESEISDDHYIEALEHIHPEVFENKESFINALRSFRSRREHVHVWDSFSFQDHLLRILTIFQLNANILIESLGDQNNLEYFVVIKKSNLAGDLEGAIRVLGGLYNMRNDLRNCFPEFSRNNPLSLIKWALAADQAGDIDAYLLKGFIPSFRKYLDNENCRVYPI